MVDALATIALEGILQKLSVAAANEVVLVWGYRERLDAFRNTVKMIHGKLRDAESQKGTKDGVMEWLKILKAVVGEADVVFDEIDYEMLRLEVKKRNKMERKVPSLPSLKKFTFRIRIGHKIEDISKKLSEILKQANNLGLHSEQGGLTPNSLHHQVETDSFLDEFSIVGRENDALHIIQLLTRSREVEKKLVIVPIVGMGGIGKTTLAKSVYNNQKIERDFDVRAWLCVSVKVDIETLLARIYESLFKKKCEVPTRENLIASLREKLGGKRYLLVLDDVWDESKEHWDDFKSCMLKVNSHNGSSILVTSRNLEVGTNDMAKDSYTLNGLSGDQCWSIFEERAFVVGRPPMPELVEIGRDIVKKCHGLPLVVKVIGGMLRCYEDKEKWLSIKDSKVWDLEGGERVESTLKLSFENLPSSILKQCFAYCSIFPKDDFIYREQLIRFWMALGLLQADETRNKEMEDVGNDIFQTLVSNSLLQDVEIDKYGRIFRCKMHDLVHDLSLSLTRHENLCLMGPTIDDVRISQVKHLAMYKDRNIYGKVKISFKEMISKVSKEDIMTSTTLHTLFFSGNVEKNISLRIFKSLRILRLSGCNVKELHNSIGDLVHLRYLDLSYNMNIKVLPRSIGRLYHLQTLKLDWCYNLNKLPEDVKNLINLRHFEFYEHRLSPKVGQLTSLQTLSAFVVGQKKGYQIEELGRLKHLRGKLCISNLEEISSKEDAAKANLSEKKNVFEIVFRWGWSNNEGANRNDKDVLEGLQPHANVKSLEIHNFSGDNLPTWVMKMAIDIQGKWTSLDKLVKIKLSGCSGCHSLPMLGNLPLLRELELKDMDKLTCLGTSLGQGNVVTEPGKPLFPSLRSLSLQEMRSLEKWTDAGMNSSTMLSPVLEKLKIKDCPKLILLDESHQHPLVSLDIMGCENLESIQSIQGLTSLESLIIYDCVSLSRIPDLHNQGHSLKSLSITRCNKLTSLPGGLECLAFLNNLALGPFSDELDSFPSLQGIEKLGSHLRSLNLIGRDHWESIPEEVKHLTALTSLAIREFGMQELPIWLRNMSSIRSIKFYGCKGLDIETVRRGAPREAIEVELYGDACI